MTTIALIISVDNISVDNISVDNISKDNIFGSVWVVIKKSTHNMRSKYCHRKDAALTGTNLPIFQPITDQIVGLNEGGHL